MRNTSTLGTSDRSEGPSTPVPWAPTPGEKGDIQLIQAVALLTSEATSVRTTSVLTGPIYVHTSSVKRASKPAPWAPVPPLLELDGSVPAPWAPVPTASST